MRVKATRVELGSGVIEASPAAVDEPERREGLSTQQNLMAFLGASAAAALFVAVVIAVG